MGINLNGSFSRLLYEKKGYEDFKNKSILMLGKQHVNFNRERLQGMLESIKFEYRDDVVDFSKGHKQLDSIELFKIIGFGEVHALDISDYEGADIVQDLTAKDLPDELKGKFDVLFDGGTTQHIFNLPQALVNMSKMVKSGGMIYHDITAGNYIDFGFYCISPISLIQYYENNGFRINSIFLMGYSHNDKAFRNTNVFSPDCRYNNSEEWFMNCATGYRVVLVCDAVKIEDKDEYNTSFPQRLWDEAWKGANKKSIIPNVVEKAERVIGKLKEI